LVNRVFLSSPQEKSELEYDESWPVAQVDRPGVCAVYTRQSVRTESDLTSCPVQRGQINAVAVQRLDRLSRRVSQCAGILDEFRRAGVEVLIAEIPESANGASGRLLTNLLSSFAEFERDMTTSRIADTRAGLVARGRRTRAGSRLDIQPTRKRSSWYPPHVKPESSKRSLNLWPMA